jgi:hypothetical protein
MNSPVVKVVAKDEGDFYFITVVTEADLSAASRGVIGRPFDPNRPRPYGTLRHARAVAEEHGVPLEIA